MAVLILAATLAGQPTGEPVRILLLDGGIVTEMTKKVGCCANSRRVPVADAFGLGQDRINFIDLFGAIVQKDGRECGRLMLSRARLHVRTVLPVPA